MSTEPAPTTPATPTPVRTIMVSHKATFETILEVPHDATGAQIATLVADEVPKYVEVKAGQHFDTDDYEVLSDETA